MLEVEGLCDEVPGAVPHGGHGVLDGPVAGEDDHGYGGPMGDRVLEEFLARDLGHAEVRDHEVHVTLSEDGDRLLAVLRSGDPVALHLQELRYAVPDVLLVVHDKDREFHSFAPYSRSLRSPSGRGRMMEKVEPRPGSDRTCTSPRCSLTILNTRVRPRPEPLSRVV